MFLEKALRKSDDIICPSRIESHLKKYIKVVNPEIKRRLTFNYD
jgi:hypothetical protein